MSDADDLPEVDHRLPDDLLAALHERYGDVPLGAYASLAAARNVPMLDVLRAAVDDLGGLALIVAGPVD